MSRLDMADLRGVKAESLCSGYLPQTPMQKAQELIQNWDETYSVDEVIIILMGLAARLGEDRVRDWNPAEAYAFAKEAVGYFEYETDIHLSLE